VSAVRVGDRLEGTSRTQFRPVLGWGPVSIAQWTTIELLDVHGHEPRQKIVAVWPWWDPNIVGSVDDRELERDEKIFGLKALSLWSRADLPDRGPLR